MFILKIYDLRTLYVKNYTFSELRKFRRNVRLAPARSWQDYEVDLHLFYMECETFDVVRGSQSFAGGSQSQKRTGNRKIIVKDNVKYR